MTPDREAAGRLATLAGFAILLIAINSQIGGPWLRYSLYLVLLWILLVRGPQVIALASGFIDDVARAIGPDPRAWFPLVPRS